MDRPPPAILGYRQDRVGARIVGLLNVLRLAEVTGAPARFVWLARPDGPWPDLARPGDILGAAFLRRSVIVTDAPPPDWADRRDLGAEAPRMDRAALAAALSRGARFRSDAAFHAIKLMDESGAEVRAAMARLARDLPLARPLARALAAARARLADLGAVAAVHVRRGDLLDTVPWCLSGWPAKYVPDEMAAAFAAAQDGPVVGFTDTPAALARVSALLVAQGAPPLIPVGDLIEDRGLTVAQRDVLELLLMAGMDRIGAPPASAFSAAARIVGQARIVPLPQGLPPAAREGAEAALLTRWLDRPDDFLCPGDRAQSLGFAIGHAIAAGLGERLARQVADDAALTAAHPFVRVGAGRAALAAGAGGLAAALARAGLDDPRTLRRDRLRLDDLALAVRASDPDLDPHAALVSHLFRPPGDGGLALPILMARALAGPGGRARAALLLPGGLGRDAPPPAWALRLDWAEFLRGRMAAGLAAAPSLNGKMRHAGLSEEAKVPDTDEGRWRLGLLAAALALHGRYLRALAVLGRLAEAAPDDPLVQKRLADTCFRLGDPNAGARHLDAALDRAPGHALLLLSRARRLGDRAALARAWDAWPDLALAEAVARSLRGRG